MLKKSDIDRKLGKYIRQNLNRGYSRESIKNALVMHGYDDKYAEKSIQKQTELKFVNRYSLIALILILAIITGANFKFLDGGFTAFVVNEPQANQYLVIDLNLIGYTIVLQDIKIVEAMDIVGDIENTGYLIIIDGENEKISSFYQTIREGNNLIYIPYSSEMKKISIYDRSSLMAEIELNKFI